MKRIARCILVVAAATGLPGCWENESQKPVAEHEKASVKAQSKLIAEPEVLPKAKPAKQSAEEPVETAAEPEAVAPSESAGTAQPKAQRRKMTDEERRAWREKRREEFYRKVDAERNKTHEQRVKEHEEAMKRAQAKRDLQEERLKRILEKRAKQQGAEQEGK